jgi:hypothetical protein
MNVTIIVKKNLLKKGKKEGKGKKTKQNKKRKTQQHR